MTPDFLKQIVDEVFTAVESSPVVKGHIFAEMAVKFVHALVLSLLPIILGNLKAKGV